MWRWLTILVAIATLSALSGVGAYQLVRPAMERTHASWQEIAWPFPRDGWPAGRAFRCDSCGGVEIDVRPKIGFCNCDKGVADDDEVDRVTDLVLLGHAGIFPIDFAIDGKRLASKREPQIEGLR